MNMQMLEHIGLLYMEEKKFEINYFDGFGVEHVLKEIEKIIGHKNIKSNIFRIEASNSIICEYFCIGFIDFMLAGKTLIDNTRFFSPYDFEKKKDHITLNYFKNK